MRDALMAEVERLGNTPLPPQRRGERMVLEEEIDQLQRVEEVLIAREGAERSTNCAPAAVNRARHSRRVTPDQRRDLRLSAFECHRGMRRPPNRGHTVAYVGGRYVPILLKKSLMISGSSDSVAVMRFAVEAGDDGAARSRSRAAVLFILS